MVAGPYQTLAVQGVGDVPFYLLRFAADGQLRSPRAAHDLAGAAAGASDVFVFSHGWNNTFDLAATRYRDFVDDYLAVRAAQRIPVPAGYSPLLVGVVWPSTSLVFPWEDGPQIAADSPSEVEELQRFVGASLPESRRAEFAELVDGVGQLHEDEARRLAELVHAALVEDDPDGAVDAASVDDVLDVWARLEVRGGSAGTVRRDPTTSGPSTTAPVTTPRRRRQASPGGCRAWTRATCSGWAPCGR